jgi:hypothetical protein
MAGTGCIFTTIRIGCNGKNKKMMGVQQVLLHPDNDTVEGIVAAIQQLQNIAA